MNGAVPTLFDMAIAVVARELGRDPVALPFSALSSYVARHVTGAFAEADAAHRAVAVSLCAVFGQKLAVTERAFWFSQREAALGAALGIPDALLAISPMALVEVALRRGDVASLDERIEELRSALRRARAAVPSMPLRLTRADYEDAFDPAFIHFLVLDEERARRALAMPVCRATQAVERVLRAPKHADVALLEAWVSVLRTLPSDAALGGCFDSAPRIVEMFARLAATTVVGAPAPESLWGVIDGAPWMPEVGRVLGMFDKATVRPVVQTSELGSAARLLRVDHAAARPALEALRAAQGAARGSLADARRGELASFVDALNGSAHLSFRRMSKRELLSEFTATAVAACLDI